MQSAFRRIFRSLCALGLVLAWCAHTGVLTSRASAAPAKPGSRKRAAAPPRASPAALRAKRLGLGTMRAAGELLGGRIERAWVRAAGGDMLPGTLRFPVKRGWFGRGFGSGKGGYHQAMDIGGETGWNVRAAAAGIVGYAGDGVSGYGNLVLLVHPGGWITAYAHNQKNLVVAGQKVERGAVLGELGSTGRSRGPHLHFELLWNGQNCDPGPLFRPTVRHRNGKPAHIAKLTWTRAAKKPRAIACYPRKHHPDRAAKPEPRIEDSGAEEVDTEAP